MTKEKPSRRHGEVFFTATASAPGARLNAASPAYALDGIVWNNKHLPTEPPINHAYRNRIFSENEQSTAMIHHGMAGTTLCIIRFYYSGD